MKNFIDVSRSSPKSRDRACLCKDSLTYSKKCCDGTLFAQGIGSITMAPPTTGYLVNQDNTFLLQQDSSKIIITI